MNIALYGFMGVGKSTVGRLLAEELGYVFIDMDKVIEQRMGISISEIFRRYGESRFRELESDLVKELAGEDDVVIACGGGAVLDPGNVEALTPSSKLIYLTATIPEIIKRTSKDGNRPLLNVPDPEKKINKLIEQRRPVYEKYATVTVDTTGLTPHELVDEIMEALR
ncbi:AAA family ATPase [Candidatus Bathyarchaeota archaeon]|nr:AAA family ATPase [Candidatus Bathyarchaeota archaeon]